jgi:hypothetical protein
MAKNLGRKYATMSEDERRAFAQEEDQGTRELPPEVAFDDPRDPDHEGRQFATPSEEFADPEHRDGTSALLDDEQHKRAVQDRATQRKRVDDAAENGAGEMSSDENV